jgi:hypothetical protein
MIESLENVEKSLENVEKTSRDNRALLHDIRSIALDNFKASTEYPDDEDDLG